MAGSFEKSVKGGTKIKLAAPKAKYVDHILTATRAGEAGVGEVFRTLDLRLRDTTWTIAFKALIIVHIMIREGEPNATLKYLSSNPRRLSPSSYADVQTQGRNIQHYSNYLIERAKAFRKAQFDYVRGGEARLKALSVDKGLLWETECVQAQIKALLKCDLLSDEIDNEITVLAFRLLTMDLLALFKVLNQATINLLEHYFEMSKSDAERALNIYKMFARQTDDVVKYLAIARNYENATKLEIPKIKHAPTGLVSSLEEYLNDNDFEINRRQYMAQQEAKKSGKVLANSNANKPSLPKLSSAAGAASISSPTSAQRSTATTQQSKGPSPDLIDFFESIEQNQLPMAQNSSQYHQPQFVAQPTGFYQHPTPAQAGFQQSGHAQIQAGHNFIRGQDPFVQNTAAPQSPQNTVDGTVFNNFNVSSPQSPWHSQQLQNVQPLQSNILQNDAQSSPYIGQSQNSSQIQGQQQPTNPFRASIMPIATGQQFSSFNNPASNPSGMSNMPTSPSGSNPFARSATFPIVNSASQQPPHVPQHPASQSAVALQPQRTGTNPFARGPASGAGQLNQNGSQSQPASMVSSPTGSTNPFRQSMYASQQVVSTWSTGLENIPTIPVFPTSLQQAQRTPPQQQQWP